MQPRFVWKPEYETGNTRIDEQHQQLIELANLLWLALQQGKAEDVVSRAIDALIAYAKYHFSEEEAFFAQVGTPVLDRHRRDHEQLTADIRAMAIADLTGAKNLGRKLEHWVENQLLPHMMYADQEALNAAAA
jgi:hemerythrin